MKLSNTARSGLSLISGPGPTKFGDKNAFSIKIQHVHLSDSALR